MTLTLTVNIADWVHDHPAPASASPPPMPVEKKEQAIIIEGSALELMNVVFDALRTFREAHEAVNQALRRWRELQDRPGPPKP